MSAPELFARLTDDWPAAEPFVPVVFLRDDMLPRAWAPVEPVAFVLEYMEAGWGPKGPAN